MENLEIFLDYIGDDSYVYRYNYDSKKYYNTGICLKGSPGNPGRPGKDGKTPHIGTNGDWFIGDVDTGVKAYTGTEVVTQLPEPSEITKNRIYIAPALNPQEGDAYSEYVTVYKNGQYKWELLGTKIDLSAYYTKTETNTLLEDVVRCENPGQQVSLNPYNPYTQSQKKVKIQTFSGTTLTAELDTYYRATSTVDTLAITLPEVDDVLYLQGIIFYFTAGTTPAVTISSTAPTGGSASDVYYQDGYAIEAGKTYEVNCLWNGASWIVASIEIVTNNGE